MTEHKAGESTEEKYDSPTVPSGIEPSHLKERIESASRLSAAAQTAVRDELQHLIASPRFSSSHRCQTLLSYVVENALLGKEELLKERSIGNAVFGRDVAYDTNSDAVVRIAAGEVRKKLAQYYFDPGGRSKVRISLPAGSYVPAFSWPESGSEETESHGSEFGNSKLDRHPAPHGAALSAKFWLRKRTLWAFAGFALSVCAVGIFLFSYFGSPTGFDKFWAPVVDSHTPVLVCVGHRMLTWPEYDADGMHAAAVAHPVPSRSNKNRSVILLSDALTMSTITGLLLEKKMTFSVRGQAITTFGDLQKRPVVLIGAFNNRWAMQLMEPMRFHFERDPDGLREWIEDGQKPGAKIGLVQTDTDDFTKVDYALVARTFDPQTNEPTIIVAGVTSTATHAASEFITNPVYLNEFTKSAPQNWQKKNMELLIVTQNVNGESGPPKIVASHFW